MAPTPISVNAAAKSTPSRYTFAGGSEVLLESAYAEFDGSAAGSAWMPSLAVYAPSGVLLGRGFPAAAVAAGGSAKVTFAPFPVAGAAATPTALTVLEAGANVDNSVFVAPWTSNGVLGLSGFFEDGSGTFAFDSSSDGIEATADVFIHVDASLTITGSGAAVHTVPPRMRILCVDFPAGLPAMNNFVDASVKEYGPFAAPVDNDLPFTGYYLTASFWTFLLAGRSLGIGLQATSPGANWQVLSGSLDMIAYA